MSQNKKSENIEKSEHSKESANKVGADKESVDNRRVEVGLSSLEEYKKIVAEAYGMPVK